MKGISVKSLVVLSILTLILSLPVAADFPIYTVIGLDVGTGLSSWATGISQNGHVSIDYERMYWDHGTPTPRYYDTAVWYNYAATDLGRLSWTNPEWGGSFGINDHGDVVGRGCRQGTGCRIYIYRNGVATDIGIPGDGYPSPTGITNGGYICGAFWRGYELKYRAFVWTDGLVSELGTLGGDESYAFAINNLGQIAGGSTTPTGDWHAFIYLPYPAYGLQAGVLHDLGTLPGGTDSIALSISGAGHVVGHGNTADKQKAAFIWQRKWNGSDWLSTITEIEGIPNAERSSAESVNSSGQVIGYSSGVGLSSPFFWQQPDGGTDLNALIGGAYSRWKVTRVAGINDQGWIAATSQVPGRPSQAILLIPATGPVHLSLTPNSGTLAIETKLMFTAVYYDPKGWQNISNCYFLINTTDDPLKAAHFRYDARTNKLFTASDGADSWMGGFAPGTVGKTVANGYGRLYCENTAVAKSGNTVTVSWTIALKSPYAKRPDSKGYMRMTNVDGAQAGWDRLGTYTVAGP